MLIVTVDETRRLKYKNKIDNLEFQSDLYVYSENSRFLYRLFQKSSLRL